MTFQIGDRVRGHCKGSWIDGLDGTVIEITDTSSVIVRFDNANGQGWTDPYDGSDGDCWGCDPDELALLTNTPRPGETPEQIAARTAPRTPYRTFDTGATRDTDEGKLDFEGFLSPLVIKAFAEYMHEKRKMPDGSLRDGDNWQKGIPLDAYMKSMWRHFFDVWSNHRNPRPSRHEVETELCALLFNVQGYLHEILKEPT